jgi:hypothetical protein
MRSVTIKCNEGTLRSAFRESVSTRVASAMYKISITALQRHVELARLRQNFQNVKNWRQF